LQAKGHQDDKNPSKTDWKKQRGLFYHARYSHCEHKAFFHHAQLSSTYHQANPSLKGQKTYAKLYSFLLLKEESKGQHHPWWKKQSEKDP